MIDSRESDINLSLESASKAKKLSEELNSQRQELILSANREREKILSEALSLKNVLIDDAKEEAKKLINDAVKQSKDILEREREEAMLEIKSQVSILAVTIAERILSEKLSNTPDNDLLIRRALENSIFKS